jgi:hypothetical protein
MLVSCDGPRALRRATHSDDLDFTLPKYHPAPTNA